MSLLEMFVAVDDFCQAYERAALGRHLGRGGSKRGPKRGLVLSEIMTIMIHFHPSHYRACKAYYTRYVQSHL